MNIKKLIIFLKVMKSLEKIDCVLTLLECKKDSENSILTSFQIPIFFQMNLGNSMNTIKN